MSRLLYRMNVVKGIRLSVTIQNFYIGNFTTRTTVRKGCAHPSPEVEVYRDNVLLLNILYSDRPL